MLTVSGNISRGGVVYREGCFIRGFDELRYYSAWAIQQLGEEEYLAIDEHARSKHLVGVCE